MISIGYLIGVFMGKKSSCELLGLSGLIGSATFTYLIFLANYIFKFPINSKTTVILSLLILLTFSIYLFAKKVDIRSLYQNLILRVKKLSDIQRSILVFLILIHASSLIQNLVWPITDWDALTLYDFRARVIVNQGGNFGSPITEPYYLDYPPFTSLLHVFTYISNIPQAKIWYSFLFAFSSILFYALSRRHVSRTKALLGVLLFSFSPRIIEHSQMAYTNFPYAIFIGFGLIYLSNWLESKNKSDLLAGSLLVAFSTWVRLTEPFWIISIVILILGVLKERKLFNIVLVAVSALIIIMLKLPWTNFAESLGQVRAVDGGIASMSVGTVKTFGIQELFMRAVETARYLWINVFKDYLTHWILLLLTLFFIRNKKVYWFQLWNYLVVFMILGVLWAGTMIFSFSYPFWNQIPDSAARMSMFLSILLPYLVIRSPLFGNEKN